MKSKCLLKRLSFDMKHTIKIEDFSGLYAITFNHSFRLSYLVKYTPRRQVSLFPLKSVLGLYQLISKDTNSFPLSHYFHITGVCDRDSASDDVSDSNPSCCCTLWPGTEICNFAFIINPGPYNHLP